MEINFNLETLVSLLLLKNLIEEDKFRLIFVLSFSINCIQSSLLQALKIDHFGYIHYEE